MLSTGIRSLLRVGSGASSYATLGAETQAKVQQKADSGALEVTRVMESQQPTRVNIVSKMPDAIIASGDDYKEYIQYNCFVCWSGIETKEDAQDYIAECPEQFEGMKTVVFITYAVIADMCRALSKEEALALLRSCYRSDSSKIEKIICQKVWLVPCP